MSHEFKVGEKGGMIACEKAGGRYEVVAATNNKIVVMISTGVETVYDVRDLQGCRTSESLRCDLGCLSLPVRRITKYINVYENYVMGHETEAAAREKAEWNALAVAVPLTVDV